NATKNILILPRVIRCKCQALESLSVCGAAGTRRRRIKCRTINSDQQMATNLYKNPAWNIVIASKRTRKENMHPESRRKCATPSSGAERYYPYQHASRCSSREPLLLAAAQT